MNGTGNILDNESVETNELLDGRFGGSLEMLLLEFTGNGVLVTEDEVNLEDRRVNSSRIKETRIHQPWFQDMSGQDRT